MSKVEGEDIVDKYVTKVKEKEPEPSHVGGAIVEDSDPLESEAKLNRHGLDTLKDY